MSEGYRLTRMLLLVFGIFGMMVIVLRVPDALGADMDQRLRTPLLVSSIASGVAYFGAVLAAIGAQRKPDSLKATAPLCCLTAFASGLVAGALASDFGLVLPAMMMLTALGTLPRDIGDPRI